MFGLSNREERFEIFIYSNATREDDKTELFKSIVPKSSATALPTCWVDGLESEAQYQLDPVKAAGLDRI